MYGWNNLQVPEALCKHSWWYRREFDIPGELDVRAGRRVWLEFDGVNHQANIWLNGDKVGEMVHPFARGAFDITASLAAHGSQNLAVLITPMPYPGSPSDKGPDGYSYHDAGTNEMNLSSPTYPVGVGLGLDARRSGTASPASGTTCGCGPPATR